MTQRKLWVLFLLAAAVLALVALSAGVSGLEMPADTPFSLAENGENRESISPVSLDDAQMSTLARLIRIGLIVVLALLPFSIIYLLLSPEGRRRILPNLFLFAMLLILARFVGRDLAGNREMDLEGAGGGLTPEGFGALPPASEFSGAVPPWLTVFTSLVLATFVVFMLALIVWSAYRRSVKPPAVFLEQIAEEAQDALAILEAGGDLRSAIVRAYQEMTRVAFAARGVARERSATAREFERQLERAGLPAEPVRDLTRLFEEVRYGAKDLGPVAERRAVASLTAIVAACQRTTE